MGRGGKSPGMPQAPLPLFPAGTPQRHEPLAFECREGQVTSFNGQLPVFTPARDDLAAFRLFTSQLVVNGTATPGEIRRVVGVPKVAVQRAVGKYRAGGSAAFFVPPAPRQGRKLTAAVLSQVQVLLDQGESVPTISGQTGVLANTIHKAIGAGRLRAAIKKKDGSARALAERGTRLRHGLWVREVRHREHSGHQVSVLAADYRSALAPIAGRMFARWTQENFLKYMREHYAIDRLVEYGTEPFPETTTVVNPAWRKLDSQVRREQALLERETMPASAR